MSSLALIVAHAATTLPAQDAVGVVDDLVSTADTDPTFVLPTVPISSVFGEGKSVIETPRAVSSVSAEMLEQYGVENIEGLAAIVPNSYTTSSFGIAGSLDLRGTSGENYFRGMKRLENGGVYPTPIGATDRVDIVRGPPSPVYGPGKIGGYLNFVPKSARAGTGKYLDAPTGKTTVTFGSWEKRVATFEQGGPLPLAGDRRAGYYAYGMVENSGSYYRNAGNEQFLFQSSFDLELNDAWRMEFGQQYHEWASIEISGINRLTQAYIDDGVYMTGRPLNNLDTSGDGLISPGELSAAGGISRTFPYGTPAATVLAALGSAFALDPATIAFVELDGSLILSDAGDYAKAKSSIWFLDFINESNPDFTIKNQTIVDTIDRKKDTSQGFATMATGFLAENKTTLTHRMAPTEWLQMTNSASASIRYFDGENRSYTSNQPFNRRDLFAGATAYDRIVSPLDDPVTAPWNANRDSEHTDYGVGVLSDMKLGERTNLIIGGRVDYLDLWARADPNSTADGPATGPAKTTGIENTETAFSYSASLSHAITPSVIPYVTHSEQQSLQIGNIGDVIPSNVPDPITDSTLDEVGAKVSLLENRLFASSAWYRQTRSAINPDTFESFTTRGEGIEFELRYLPTKRLSLSAAANWQRTEYLRAPTQFTVPPEFFGISGVDGYGGLLVVNNLPQDDTFRKRGGLPNKVFSLFGTYSWESGFGLTLGAIYTDEMWSGSAKTFLLPSVTRVDAAFFYSTRVWDFRFRVNNATDERYFQANSPDNNGNTVAIQKLPRNYEMTVGYKF